MKFKITIQNTKKLKPLYLFLTGVLVLAGLLSIIGSKINIEKFASWIDRSASAQTTCHILSSPSTVPSGFGAWWGVFTGKLLIKAECSSSSAVISVGDGDSHYIYEKGYRWDGASWQPISFSGGTKVGSWYKNSASAAINLSASELEKNNYIVAYVCTWKDNAWKCGCRDSDCTNRYWQLQAFKKGADSADDPPTISITNPNNNQTVSNTITISANASDDLGVKEVVLGGRCLRGHGQRRSLSNIF